MCVCGEYRAGETLGDSLGGEGCGEIDSTVPRLGPCDFSSSCATVLRKGERVREGEVEDGDFDCPRGKQGDLEGDLEIDTEVDLEKDRQGDFKGGLETDIEGDLDDGLESGVGGVLGVDFKLSGTGDETAGD